LRGPGAEPDAYSDIGPVRRHHRIIPPSPTGATSQDSFSSFVASTLTLLYRLLSVSTHSATPFAAMDSMRSLNRSLPSTPPRRRKGQPTEQLLQAFKSAALSVTNLYKTAAADQATAHESGYQDALEDLIGFLDKEGLGLGDGEGWKVRQWATERLHGYGHASSESDEETEEDKRARSSSPVLQRKPSRETMQLPPQEPTNARSDSAPPVAENPAAPVQVSETQPEPPSQSEFTFRASHAYPVDADMETSETLNPTNVAITRPSRRLEVLSRPPRTSTRHNTRQTRGSSSLGSLGLGSGVKRKVPFGDFFDLSNLGNGKDAFGGGGKRGRFI
jgi:hypothetical protein